MLKAVQRYYFFVKQPSFSMTFCTFCPTLPFTRSLLKQVSKRADEAQKKAFWHL